MSNLKKSLNLKQINQIKTKQRKKNTEASLTLDSLNKNDGTKKTKPSGFKNLRFLELIHYYRITAYPGVREVSLVCSNKRKHLWGCRRVDPRGI